MNDQDSNCCYATLGGSRMCRFALARRGQNSQPCTRCHTMARRDVSGTVHVGVRPAAAGDTYDDRLAPAVLGRDVLADVAGLRRIRGVDSFDPSRRFLLQPPHEQTPPGFEDAPAVTRVLCHVPTRIYDGSTYANPSCPGRRRSRDGPRPHTGQGLHRSPQPSPCADRSPWPPAQRSGP